MTSFGYKLSSEEHDAPSLVRYARMAEEAGFEYAAISDHYHPWIDAQGESPFVWGVIGAVSQATERLRVGTLVTCPTVRIHPAIVAQAAATAAQLLPGRFFLGLGSGENLNEHVLGDRWPAIDARQDMLEEAIAVIRELWKGEDVTHRGEHYVVEQARVYSLPDELPPIYVAAAGEQAAELAGRVGDGLVALAPEDELLKAFDEAGGRGKPKSCEITLCWAKDKDSAVETVQRIWPNALVPGELVAELPLPRHYEQVSELVESGDIQEKLPLGPDPERHLEAIREYVDAGYDEICLHQVGYEQEGFFEFWRNELAPELDASTKAA